MIDLNNETLQNLLKLTVKNFHSPESLIVYKILLINQVLTEEQFRKKLNLLSREFNRLIAPLKSDSLIKQESKLENVNGKTLQSQVYYIDPFESFNVIKYKIKTISNKLVNNTKHTDNKQEYICKKCNKTYNEVEALTLMKNFVFLCKCGEKLEILKVEKKSQFLYKKFVEFCKEIVKSLKSLDGQEIQRVDYFTAVNNRKKFCEHNVKSEEKEKKTENLVKKTEKIESESFTFSNNIVNNINIVNTIDTDIVNNTIDIVNINNNNKKTIIVKVNKKEKLLHEITDDDMECMTESEYNAYFDLIS